MRSIARYLQVSVRTHVPDQLINTSYATGPERIWARTRCARMCRAVLGIHDQAGPVLVRTSEGADKPSSQDMAVLGSMLTYAEGLRVQIGAVATDDFVIGFRRVSPTLLMTLITTSKLHSEPEIKQFLQEVYFAVQLLVGPSELEIIAAVNTANNDLRRALLGTCGVLDALMHVHGTLPGFLLCSKVTAVPHKYSAPIDTALCQLSHGGDADYVAITYDNVYAMATPCFWSLHPQELLTLQMLLHSMPASTTSAQVPLHLPQTAANKPWYLLMVTLTAGCRLILLTRRQTLLGLALLQALAANSFGLLKQPLLQARDHAMSSTLLREHSLVAFVLHQSDPACVMLSSPQQPTPGKAATGPVTHGSVSPTQAELHAADDLARHQEALGVVSAFAAQLHGDMQTCTSGLAVTHDPEVLQACCKVAGLRLVAVTQQQDKAKRTLYAALSRRLEKLSDDVATAHVTSILQQLPWLGAAR